jgi:MFS family permease
VQYPLGVLSDRIDRRRVLIGTCVLIAVMAGVASMIGFGQFGLIALIFAIWAGATETIYSVANAHANDRAEPGTFVALASTMLVAWSIAAFVAPLVVTSLTPVFGPKTFMYAVVVLAFAYAVFVAIRLRMREAIPPEETEQFEMMTAQVPDVTGLVVSEEELTGGATPEN